MTRETFTSLLTTTKQYASLEGAATTFDSFLKLEINKAVREIQAFLNLWINQDSSKTKTSVADQQYYDYPVDTYPPIDAATYTISGVVYPLTVIHSQEQWDEINSVTFAGTTIPQYIFPRRDDFGIWPIPAASSQTITLVMRAADKDMSQSDYTTGTITTLAAQGTAVTGSGTTWTAAFVGRWFKVDNDGHWYRISARGGNTSITLDSAYEGTAISAGSETYTIGESPEIPPELHALIPFKAAAGYLVMKNNPDQAQRYLNYYWTGDFLNSDRNPKFKFGGLLGAKNRYIARNSTGVVVTSDVEFSVGRDEAWSTTLTS